MIRTKLISSLDKCFIDSNYDEFAEIKSINIYKNTDAVFQLIAYNEEEARVARMVGKIEVEGDLAEFVKVRSVECIPNYVPIEPTPKYAAELDPDYIRNEPGLYPDLLLPLHHTNAVTVLNQQIHPVWIDVKNDGSFAPGEHTLKFKLYNQYGEVVGENEITITLDPGCAFGTGTHQTTQLCMKALEKYLKKDDTMADIGTGSGILAICAKKFGASSARPSTRRVSEWSSRPPGNGTAAWACRISATTDRCGN